MNSKTNSILFRVWQFAVEAHGDQVRKYTGEPYIAHLAEVAGLVVMATHDEQVIAAAYLHDTAEDTPVTLEEIGAAFGEDVRFLVDVLTDAPQEGRVSGRAQSNGQDTISTGPKCGAVHQVCRHYQQCEIHRFI